MAINISVDFPGVEIIDDTAPTSIVSPYGVAIMLGSATKGLSKELRLITSPESFVTEYGNDSGSYKYVKAFFANLLNSSIRLYFYRVNAGTAGTAVAATSTDYVDGFNSLDNQFNPGGLVLTPEFYETFSTVGDATARRTVTNAMKTFCDFNNGSMWMGIADIPQTIDNITDAVAEAKANLVAPRGEIFVYSPYYLDVDDTVLLPSAARAAITLSLWASGRYNAVPADRTYVIKDAFKLGFNVPKTERTIAHTGNVNLIRYFENFGYAADDSITLSTNKEYYQINSIVCFRIVAYLLENAMEEYIHSPISGDASVLVSIAARLERVCFDSWSSGYLVGRISGTDKQRAYKITVDVETLPDPANAALVADVEIRPAYSLQKVLIRIRNILGSSTDLEPVGNVAA